MDSLRAYQRSRQQPRIHSPRGFTLFELLIVLAILTTIVALSWPALEQFYTDYRVRQGGHLVQARMAGARVHAIDTGVDYQFRFEPGGQRFLILPNDTQALLSPTGATQTGGATRRIPKIAGRLPSPKAHFDPASTGGSTGQQVPSDWLSGIKDAGDLNSVNWSAPILFHADGSATNAQVMIADNKSRFVTVTIRALTGGVSVSNIANGGRR
jgi:prepilin-type N-terminal cleavage/methylation domain-containing protein